jgi:hypothetical protein
MFVAFRLPNTVSGSTVEGSLYYSPSVAVGDVITVVCANLANIVDVTSNHGLASSTEVVLTGEDTHLATYMTNGWTRAPVVTRTSTGYSIVVAEAMEVGATYYFLSPFKSVSTNTYT